MPVTKVCPHCQKQFSIPPSSASHFKFCSWECRLAHTPRRTCKKCGKEFKIKKSKIDNGRGSYCSKECWSDRSEKHDIECQICGKHIRVIDSYKDKKYCSYECYYKSKLLPDPSHVCLGCGETFINRKHTQKGFRYCSRACFIKNRKRTSIEVAVANLIKSINIDFVEQYRVGAYVCDFHIPNHNLIIEADGDYWHSLPNVIKKDERKNAFLKSKGYLLLRLTESQINNDTELCKQKIIELTA